MRSRNHFRRRVQRCVASILCVGTLAFSPVTAAQKVFASPDAAAQALVDGIARHDGDAIKAVLGSQYAKYVPIAEIDSQDVTDFLAAWAKSNRIVAAGDAKAYLEVGKYGWTLPIPIVRSASGWRFDTRGTSEELRTRRIGRNELAVIQVVLAFTDAQAEYAQRNPNRASVQHYAQKILSSPGKRDGLYWPAAALEEPSPLGPIAADSKPGDAFHGYHYRILKAQGGNAPGGAKDYVQGDLMTGGFALIAWPAKYGDTGVMTFMVSDAGQIYQRDLGSGTDSAARAMTRFDPGSGWQRVQP